MRENEEGLIHGILVHGHGLRVAPRVEHVLRRGRQVARHQHVGRKDAVQVELRAVALVGDEVGAAAHAREHCGWWEGGGGGHAVGRTERGEEGGRMGDRFKGIVGAAEVLQRVDSGG